MKKKIYINKIKIKLKLKSDIQSLVIIFYFMLFNKSLFMVKMENIIINDMISQNIKIN